jgi:hypothetical protein
VISWFLKSFAFKLNLYRCFTGSRDFTTKQWSLPDLALVRTFVQEKPADRDDVLAVLVGLHKLHPF